MNKLINEPAQGVIADSQSSQHQKDESAQTFLDMTGRYISFSYPANFTVNKPSTPGGTQLENFSLTKKSFPNWYLNVQVSRLSGTSLSDDASYNLRQQNPQRFSRQSVLVGSQNVEVFTDHSDGYGQAAFLRHGDLLATVSLSSYDSNSADAIRQTFMGIINSLEWKR